MDDKAYFINAFFEVDTVELGSESARELRGAGNLFTSSTPLAQTSPTSWPVCSWI